MRTITKIAEMRSASDWARTRGRRIGLVPTMGALHDGHLSLVQAARSACQCVVVSIFVNPTQFGPGEDLAKYPRNLERDKELLERENVDVLFAPEVQEVYPAANTTWVNVEGLSDRLDGRSRPGHFRGVATVVAKLFNIVTPDVAFFGQKDAAQLAVIRQMVRDLNFSVEIAAGAIVREPDGLAMSSRNVYLDAQQREQALVLDRSLKEIENMHAAGERCAASLIARGMQEIGAVPAVKVDFLEIVNPDTLEPVESVHGKALVAVAVWIGPTRLIDNVVLQADDDT